MMAETALRVLREFDAHHYAEDYEFRADGDYKPNEQEKALIEDAVLGALGVVEERIRSAINAAPASAAEPVWLLIETAPKDDWSSPLLVCRIGKPNEWFNDEMVAGYADVPASAYWNEYGDCWTWTDRPHDACEPTHWSPLPPPPVTIGAQQQEKADDD